VTRSFCQRALCAWAASVALSVSASVQADEADPIPEADAPLQNVVVTAQRRTQSAQDVGVAITAVSGETLEGLRIQQPLGLSAISAGLSTMNATTDSTPLFLIRGIGLDDFNMNNSGKNTAGGAINIISRRPTGAPEGYVDLDYSRWATTDVTAAISGPLTDSIKARLAGMATRQDQGYQTDIDTGATYGKLNRGAARAQIESRGNNWDGDDLSSLAVDDDFVHLVWADGRAGFLGAWYARVPLSSYRAAAPVSASGSGGSR